MLGWLKQLLGSNPSPRPTPLAEHAAALPATETAAERRGFLRRETLFDRQGKPGAHLFRLQAAGRPMASDRWLLEALAGHPVMPDGSLACIAIDAASLELPAVDHLRGPNFALFLHLTGPLDIDRLLMRIAALRERQLAIGLFRAPDHPGFGRLMADADYAVIDASTSEAAAIRDFAVAVRAAERSRPIELVACNLANPDEHRLCHHWHYAWFHAPFASQQPPATRPESGDPHKVFLLELLRLAQGEADNGELAEAMKQDPMVAFRILRYLNSPLLGLDQPISSLNHALTLLGRQQLTRWLAVLLFSVREPDFADWLLVENALTRGRLMEELGRQLLPGQPPDPLFLVGIFSCLDRLLRRPLATVLADLPLAPAIRSALLERQGPYASLLTLAEASESFDPARIATAAGTAGVDADAVNRALLAATAWASEVTGHWH